MQNVGKTEIEFYLRGFPKARRVYLVSHLSTWQPGAFSMAFRDGTWRIRIALPPGDFGYVFAVDGCRWFRDPTNRRTSKIPFPWAPLSRCSVISVPPSSGNSAAMPASRGESLREPASGESTPPPETEPPAWAQGAVFYHILIDRFCNGDPSNDPPHSSPWGAAPTGDAAQSYGGDLQGVLDKLDYVRGLGADALYLTPVFRSPTWHKYDAESYEEVDPAFGDNALFCKVVQEAHARGMRVILDGVFHHTSTQFPPFRDLLENQERSRYASWFLPRRFPVKVGEPRILQWLFSRAMLYQHFRLRSWLRGRFPLSYETFLDAPSMPKANLLDPDASAYFLEIAERWVREAGLDGWRLDSALCGPPEFWRRLAQRVKAANPEAFLMGELECEPGGICDMGFWFESGCFDSAMNYWLRGIILDFAAHRTAGPVELARRLEDYLARIPSRFRLSMYNILGSTETPRLFNVCGGDIQKIQMSLLLQMALPGAPVICYGDEIGLEGASIFSTNRACMEWDETKWSTAIRDYLKALLQARCQNPALRLGDFEVILKDDAQGLFGFRRRWEENAVACVLNNSGRDARVTVEATAGCGKAIDLITGENYPVGRDGCAISIPKRTGALIAWGATEKPHSNEKRPADRHAA